MKIFTKILILIIFVLASNTSFAQSSNSQTLNFKDISPGVVGELNVYSETLSEDKGIVSVTGSLRYEFPPQPTTFSITLRNSDGKGVFKDYTQTITTSTPSRFSFVFENIPLDKTSTTRDLATRDKFQIISSVDKGVDFFFQSPTYITFKKYVAPKTTTTTINNQTTTSLDPTSSNISLLSRLSVLSTTPVPDANGKKRVRATLMLVSHLAQNQELPVYGGLARLDGDKVEFNTDQWQRVSTRGTADDMPGMATGITRHDFILEQGKTYTFWAWLSINPLTEINPSGNEILPVDAFTSTMFVVNSDYLFGKPVSNSAPVLQKTNNAKSKAILNSLTSDYRAGNIDFFTIGSTNVSTKASDNAYVFLTNIPGLANSTSTPVKNATDCGPSNPDCKAFDPTIDGAFNDFISTIINMIYGFVILGAAIRIIISGIKLMGSVTPFGKNTAKEEIINAFIAIALALGTYLILNTINPKLTKFSVGNVLKGSDVNTFKGLEFEAALSSPGRIERLSERQLTKTFTRTEFYPKIKEFSSRPEYNIPHCLVQVTILAESGGKRGLIGHDENVASSGIPARRDFIASGKKHSGKTFNPEPGLITTRNHLNDDHKPGNIYSAPDESRDDLGLDWRFSHGMGMFGVTFFPKGAKYGDYSKGIYMPILKQNVTPRMIHTNPDIDLKVAIEMMKEVYEICDKDITKTFNKYVGGGCSPKPGSKNYNFVINESIQRKALYDQCVAQDK